MWGVRSPLLDRGWKQLKLNAGGPGLPLSGARLPWMFPGQGPASTGRGRGRRVPSTRQSLSPSTRQSLRDPGPVGPALACAAGRRAL